MSEPTRSEPAPGRPADTGRVVFDERLWVPWWGWMLAVTIAAVLAAEVHLGYPGVRAWLPYLLIVLSALALVGWLGRVRVRLAHGELQAGQAHLPLRYVGEVDVVSGAAKRRALGPELDPTAFVLHRGWVRSAVRLQLTDPDDPTPYWVVSTRQPERLAELLRARPER